MTGEVVLSAAVRLDALMRLSSRRQLGHANLAITTTYLAGISPVEVLSAISHRQAPQITTRTEGR